MKISVVIPAHNEESTVGRMVSLLFRHFDASITEILIVNDCSTDGTGKVLKALAEKYTRLHVVTRKKNGGVGHAIRLGLHSVSEESTHVLLLDCDFLENIQDIRKILSNRNHADGIIGSRFMKNGRLQNYPLVKKLANRSFHFLTGALLGLPHIDVTNNFKLYRKEVIEKIRPHLTSGGFSINAETGIYPHLLGFTTKEVPVSWIGRKEDMGSSSFNILKAGPGYAKVLYASILFKYSQRGQAKQMHKHRPEEERKHFDMLIDEIGETYYGNLRPVARIRFTRKAEAVLRLIKGKKKQKILEYGCGTGILARYLLQLEPDLAIEGVDISPKAIAVAKKTLKKYKNAHFQAADALHMPFKDNAFDFVVGNSILHHIDLPNALKEIVRVLKPGGKIWFCEPNMLNPQIALEKNVPFVKSFFQDSEDERAFSRWGIAKDLKRHGFRNVTTSPYEFLHPLLPGPLLSVLVPFCLVLEKVPVVNEFAGTMQIIGENGKRARVSRGAR